MAVHESKFGLQRYLDLFHFRVCGPAIGALEVAVLDQGQGGFYGSGDVIPGRINRDDESGRLIVSKALPTSWFEESLAWL